MKKILLMALCSAFIFVSCTVENDPAEISEENFSYDLSEDVHSVFGIYKGVFTTNDAKYRGTIEITVPNPKKKLLYRYKTKALAAITLHDGTKYYIKSDQSVSQGKSISNMIFESDDIYFTLNVAEEGLNPRVSEVIFKNLESDIVIAKHTSRAPVETVSGTWQCTACNDHPVVGQGGTQTFNMMFVDDGMETTIETQSTTNSTVTDGIGVQTNNCSTNGNTSACAIESGDGTTNVGFFSNGNPVTWSGTHSFNNEDTSVGNDCSNVSGTWQWQSISYGVLSGTFTGDGGPGATCPSTATTLIFEDFEDAMVNYVAVPADDLSDIGSRDYYGIINPTPPTGVVLTGILGTGYYGAEDTNGATNSTSLITLTWSGLSISSYTSITFSGYFGEDAAADGENDWDTTSSVRIEYRIDGGSWTPVIAYESEIGPDGNGTNEVARLDTDFDGTGDGPALTDELTQQFASRIVSGSNMDVRVLIDRLNDADEDIAIDNIQVIGN